MLLTPISLVETFAIGRHMILKSSILVFSQPFVSGSDPETKGCENTSMDDFKIIHIIRIPSFHGVQRRMISVHLYLC